MEHCLLTMLGLQLSHFLATQAPAGYTRVPRPMLILCLDQGSPGWSSCFWLAYHCLLRVAVLHDPFHRCWNDLCGAVKDTGLWWAVQLSTMVYNVMYGPWEGSKWFNVLRLGALDFFKSADASDPLLAAHYPFICRDMGISEEGTPEHIQQVANMVASGKCVEKKGPRSANRRWFQWFEATDFHLDWWHSRLMIMSYCGLQLGAYPSPESLPLFGGGALVGLSPPAADEAEQVDVAGAGAVVEEMVGQASSASGAHDPPKEPIKAEDELSKLRKSCRNSMFVAAAIYGVDNMCRNVRLVFLVLKSFWDDYSERAATVRGAEGTRQYYLDVARSAYLQPCFKSVCSTMDTALLSLLGYDTEATAAATTRRGRTTLENPRIVADSELAKVHIQLVLHSCKRRVASMSWHSHSWPGLLALLLAEDSATFNLGCKRLLQDFLAWWDCKAEGAANTFLRGCASRSPFATVLVQELSQVLATPSLRSVPDILGELREAARELFSTLGTSKPCEDLFRILREREERDTNNRVITLSRQFSAAQEAGILEQHGRAQVQVPEQWTATEKTPTTVFWPSHSHLSLPDTLTGRLQWTSLAPESYPTLPAQIELMRVLHRTGDWDLASRSWLCSFLPVGVVFRRKGDALWQVSLGSVGLVAVVGWPLAAFSLESTTVLTFAAECPQQLTWTCVLDDESFEVLPATEMGPNCRLALPAKLKSPSAVCWLQTGPVCSLLEHAATQCFWQVSRTVLQKLADFRGLGSRWSSEWLLLRALLESILGNPGLEEEMVLGLLKRRCQEPPVLTSDLLPPGVVEELAHPEDLKDLQDTRAGRRQPYFVIVD